MDVQPVQCHRSHSVRAGRPCKVQNLGFKGQVLGFMASQMDEQPSNVSSLTPCKVQHLGFIVLGLVFRVQGIGFMASQMDVQPSNVSALTLRTPVKCKTRLSVHQSVSHCNLPHIALHHRVRLFIYWVMGSRLPSNTSVLASRSCSHSWDPQICV